MVKSFVDGFVTFRGKYAEEVGSIASALRTIMDGLALMPDNAAKVYATIDRLEEGALALAKAKAPAKVTIGKADIDAAVIKALPGALKTAIEAAVTAKLEAVVEEKVAAAVASAMAAASQDAAEGGE